MNTIKIFHYDLETTGTSSDRNGVVQLATIIDTIDLDTMADVDKIPEPTVYNFPMRPFPSDEIEAEALKVNRIDRETIMDRPDPLQAYLTLISLLDSTVDKFNRTDKLFLSGYNNSKFDDLFLRRWFKHCQTVETKYLVFGSYFRTTPIDSLQALCWLQASGFIDCPNLKLATVCEYFGIALNDAHDAEADIRATRTLTMKLLRLFARIFKFSPDQFVELMRTL